jgi:hypothetical protein
LLPQEERRGDETPPPALGGGAVENPMSLVDAESEGEGNE